MTQTRTEHEAGMTPAEHHAGWSLEAKRQEEEGKKKMEVTSQGGTWAPKVFYGMESTVSLDSLRLGPRTICGS